MESTLGLLLVRLTLPLELALALRASFFLATKVTDSIGVKLMVWFALATEKLTLTGGAAA